MNESVSNDNKTLTDTCFLKHPSLDLVKRIGRYNRANTCETTVFYLAESIDTALKEIHPPKGKRITVGVWKPKHERTFTSYPIIHSKVAIATNEEISTAYNTVKQLEEVHDPLHINYMNYYLNLLSREYSKPVKHHLEYMISATFSEHIFEINDGNPDFNFDCIIYPSVGNEFQTRNVALKSSVAEEDFVLEKAIEFEISESFYDRTPIKTGNPEAITVANVKNYRETFDISADGKIAWSNYIYKKDLDLLE